MRTIQGPTLANPFKFETVDELRRELDNANHVVLQQFLALTQVGSVVEQMAGSYDEVLLAHLRGDTARVGELLTAYLATRQSLRKSLEDRLHSDQSRVFH